MWPSVKQPRTWFGTGQTDAASTAVVLNLDSPRILQGGIDDPSFTGVPRVNNTNLQDSGLDDLTGAVPCHPRTMNWEDHFVWSGDYLEIVPLTAIGRVTIRELCLNRTGIRNVRRVLYVAGEHPPKR